MKKQLLWMISGVLIVCICIFVYHSFASGTTLQSREQLLENAIANGNHWRILKETKIEDALISAAYSTDDQIALVVFVPTFFGGYQVETTTRCHADDIIRINYHSQMRYNIFYMCSFHKFRPAEFSVRYCSF